MPVESDSNGRKGVYIRTFGWDWTAPERRVVAAMYEILGVTVGTVKSQTHPALGKLRSVLSGMDEGGIGARTLEGERS